MCVMNKEHLELMRKVKSLDRNLNLSNRRERGKDLKIKNLKDKMKELEKTNKKLEKKVRAQAEKIASLQKNSSTSSIKGSSEITNPKKAKKKDKREN